MENIVNYADAFPDLILEIMDFFSFDNLEIDQNTRKANPKSVADFILHYKQKYLPDKNLQPRLITKICDKLCDLQVLSLISSGRAADYTSTYLFSSSNKWSNLTRDIKRIAVQRYECAVYGFSYIYDLYRSMIVPIIYYTEAGDITVGTGFYWGGGIATAKHCLENSIKISIPNISAALLNQAPIYISDNPYMDVAFIDADVYVLDLQKIHGEETSSIRQKLMITNEGNPEIMDEIITMGYPKIPGFTHFQTVEKATVSALPQNRFTSTTGEIVAIENEIWMKENLFLITAKIKGGNSGGPVFNKFGELVGIVSEIPFSEGDYDDLGYGTAIPVRFLHEIQQNRQMTMEGIHFVDYSE